MRTCKVLTCNGQDKFLLCWWKVDPNLFQLPPLLQGQGFPIGIRQIEHILEFIKLHIFFNAFWIVFVQYVPLSFLWGASLYSLTPESFRAVSESLIYHCNINLHVVFNGFLYKFLVDGDPLKAVDSGGPTKAHGCEPYLSFKHCSDWRLFCSMTFLSQHLH